tara:strand:- start:362 stop:568 length:207 start_codon:yes stop_codon:yes gene_type:complete
MSENQKRIDQLKLEMQVAVDEYNKVQQKIQELVVAREGFKIKAFACEERIKELQGKKEISTQIQQVTS